MPYVQQNDPSIICFTENANFRALCKFLYSVQIFVFRAKTHFCSSATPLNIPSLLGVNDFYSMCPNENFFFVPGFYFQNLKILK